MRFLRSTHAACSKCGEHIGFLDFDGEVQTIDRVAAKHGRALMIVLHECHPAAKTKRYVEHEPTFPGWISDAIVRYLRLRTIEGVTIEEIKLEVFPRCPEVTAVAILATLKNLERDRTVQSREGVGYRGQLIWSLIHT